MQDPVQSVVSPHPIACNPTSCPSSPHVGAVQDLFRAPPPTGEDEEVFPDVREGEGHEQRTRRAHRPGVGERASNSCPSRHSPRTLAVETHFPLRTRLPGLFGQGVSELFVGQENVSNSSKTQGEKPWSLSHLPAIHSPVLQIWKLRPREVTSEGQDHSWHLSLFFCY